MQPRSLSSALHLGLVVVLAAYFLIFPSYRAFFPLEIGPTESWNAYHQDAVIAGEPLYPAPGGLTVNNYPPLSFYAIGWVASWTGDDPLFVGRVFSAVALVGLALMIAVVVRRLGGGWTAGGIAGAWFVAFLAVTFDTVVGADDPQLFAEFMMLCALAWFLARDARGLAAEPPIFLMAVAGFWKHNIAAVPVTVLLWLILREGRRALRPCLFAIGCVVVGLALCAAAYGPHIFFANLLGPRNYEPFRMLIALPRLQWVLPALAIWAVWAWGARHTQAARFTALFIGVGLVLYVVQWTADAVLTNSQFDLDIAAAVGLGLAYEHAAIRNWSRAAARTLVIAIVAIRLVATGHIESALVAFDSNYRRTISDHVGIERNEADRVAHIAGSVGCMIKQVCRMAGKAFVFDEFTIGQLIKTGAFTPARLQEILRERGITYVAIDPRASAESLRRDWFAKVFHGERWD
jgi:hypothetical protein